MNPTLGRSPRLKHLQVTSGARNKILSLATLLLILAAAGGSAKAQDNVTEGQIVALFTSGGSTTPLFTTNNPFFFTSDNTGTVVSAAYNLGGGLYLYAYEFDCASPITYTVTRLDVPLAGSVPMPVGAVTTGTFWTGAGPTGLAPYTGPFAAFNGFQTFGVDPSTDPITGAFVSPNSITFSAPGIFSINNGLPQGVFLTTPVFGFITNVAPKIITGAYATDANGIPLPPVQIVAPQGAISMLDPVPDLIEGTRITTDPDTLATKGRLVSGVAADGVTQVLLRMPTTNVGDQFTVTIQDFTSPDEVGALGNPGDTTFSQSSLTVTAVQTSKGPMAFGIYLAPVDFPRGGGQDANAGSRTVTIQVQPSGTATMTKVTILRPPVVLVHGLWGDGSAWNNFSPLYTSSGPDPRFSVKRADYSDIVGSSFVASVPAYDPAVLSSTRGNALGFAFNAPFVLQQVREVVKDFKDGQNPASIQVAAVQADIVGHSMGGDITRTLPLQPNFASNDTFGQGVIHKLITIGTPHLGSPLAIDLLQDANSCVRNVLAPRGFIALASATFSSGVLVTGGVGDLQGDGSGGSLSPALQSLGQPGPIPLRTALIAGVTAANNLNSLDCTFCTARGLRLLCGGNPLADNLTSQGWPTVFNNQPNDAIVPQSSELDLLSGFVAVGVIHTDSLAKLDFTGPGELDPASGISNQVINLLNTLVTSSQFNSLTP